jgi:hypothetical protein
MTRRERLERKIDRCMEWAEGREKKATAERSRGDMSEAKTGIPFGQPILVGHHSEGRHRRVVDRAHRAMDRAIENEKMADTHRSKAAGLSTMLDRTVFSDDPDAVEALEARIAALDAERQQNNTINKIVRKKPKNVATPEKIAALAGLGMSEAVAEKLFEPDFAGRIGVPAYVNQNLGGRIKAARGRLEIVKTQAENRKAAEESPDGVVVKENCYGDLFVTFSEKPDREILTALKTAGYRWKKGSWVGPKNSLPTEIAGMGGGK